MTVDIIIPAYKPDSNFRKTLEMLKAQTVKPDRIIIINTEQKYFKQSLIDEIENVELLHIRKEEFDHGGTRNMGASLSKADIVMFMTQDAIPADKELVANLIKPFKDMAVAACYGRQMADPVLNPIEAFTRTFNYPEQSCKKTISDLHVLGIKTFFCSNVCAAYRKKDYNAMGGFVRKTIFNEDMIMASKLIEKGKTIAYAADAKVWHWHDYTAKEQLHRNFDLAVSQQDAGGLFTKVSAKSEGIKMVKAAIGHLLSIHKIYLIPKLIVQSGYKYIGFKLGYNYKKLPKGLIMKLTMNPSYWHFSTVKNSNKS